MIFKRFANLYGIENCVIHTRAYIYLFICNVFHWKYKWNVWNCTYYI